MLKPGHVIDIYDDAEGKHIADGGLLKKYGELDVAAADDLAKLPDKDFALVVLTKTGQKQRKYPVHTPDSLALSIHYFGKTGMALPEKARAIAASNFVLAHLRFGADPPEGLRKLAKEEVAGPYFDEGSHHPESKIPPSSKPFSKFALSRPLVDGRRIDAFPVDTVEAALASVAAFKKHAFDMTGRDRYLTARALSASLKGFGKSDDALAKLASFTPNPAFLTHIEARRQVTVDETDLKTLDSIEKLAGSLPGPLLATALEQFDRRTGLHHYWDERIRNPWDSCFSVKTAGVKVGDKNVTKASILKLIDSGKLASMFKQSTIKDFRKSPLEVFESLPTPTKQAIANLID